MIAQAFSSAKRAYFQVLKGLHNDACSRPCSFPTGLPDVAGALFVVALAYLLTPMAVRAQVELMPVINMIAGNGINGYSGDNGPAISAELTYRCAGKMNG